MTRIKICGITNYDDAAFAVVSGADALGFIFAESPRRISQKAAKEITQALSPFVNKIGVFVDEPIGVIAETIIDCRLDAVQIHGDINFDDLKQLPIPFIKTFRICDERDLDIIQTSNLSYFHLDTYQPGKMGGTGKQFDWNIAKEASRYGRVILSGGLNPENISQALETVQPYAVDVCGGVEDKPGKKNHEKIKKFINEVRSWDNRTN
ncbi:MAG: phosphoribosylanthranilate isomerase [candidate division Zixibacteria bacterium]